MTSLRRIAAFALILVAAFGIAACSGSARTGAPYTLKPDREIEAYLPGDVATVHSAALYVVREHFGYRMVRHASDRREGYIEARTAQDNVVRVETYTAGERISRVEIFVGPLGDEAAMKDILAEIDLEVNRP